MTAVTKKRLLKLSIATLIFLCIYVAEYYYQSSINASAFFTGWLLLILLLLLIVFNLRKKLSFLPLGSAYTWAQVHIYSGLIMLAVFFLHLNQIPNGVFEVILAVVFLLLSVSGVYGLYLSRTLPPKLSHQSEYVIYERISGLRESLRKEVERLVDEARDNLSSKALAEFYEQSLFNFMSKNHNFLLHVYNPSAVYASWKNQFLALNRYLSEDELKLSSEIQSLTFQKIDIDNQYASRSMLKYWLFVHIPLSYALLIMAVFHLLLAYSFSWSSN